jgi:predicted DNA-binding antitoxin AbrB/MazE fold protein
LSQIITAVYEKGLPHPAVPLNLQEHESVRILMLSEKAHLKPARSDFVKPAIDTLNMM